MPVKKNLPRKPSAQARLARAVGRGSVAGAGQALDDGAQVDYLGKSGGTPLIMAVTHGRVELARLLIARGAQVDKREGNLRWDALMWASRMCKKECVRELLAAGADPRVEDVCGETAFMHAGTGMMKSTSEQLGCLAALVEAGADPCHKSKDGRGVLDMARAAGPGKLADWLMAQMAQKERQEIGDAAPPKSVSGARFAHGPRL